LPSIVILAGPNGAGKTTAASHLLGDVLGVATFVNADVVAQELSPGAPELAAFQAGRQVLAQLESLSAAGATFAFETTLAGRSYAAWLRRCRAAGYTIHLVFLWLPTADLAVERVARRVASGGHDIPETVVRRRYAAGLRNFFALYRPLATNWRLYDSSGTPPRLVAEGVGARMRTVADRTTWSAIEEQGRV
jgi:predicted ABC-type ATPase